MKTYFWRFGAPTSSNKIGYFGHPVYQDRLKLNILPIDSFPVFNERITKENDFLVFKAGDWDIRVSLMQDETSVNGDSILDFFTGNLANTYLFLAVIELDETDVNSRRSGTIKIDSIEINKNTGDEGDMISFTVEGILKDISKYYSSRMYDALHVSGNPTFNSYLADYGLLGHSSPVYLFPVNNLSISTKLGFMPLVHGAFHNTLSDEFWFDERNQINRWDIIKDLAFQLGFFIKCIPYAPDIFSYERPPFQLILYFRSNGFASSIINVKEHIQGYSAPVLDKKFIFIKSVVRNDYPGESECFGMLMDANNFIVNDPNGTPPTDYWEIDKDENVLRIVGQTPPSGFTEETPLDDIHIIDFTQYSNDWYDLNGDPFTHSVIFSRIFCQSVNGLYSYGYPLILERLIGWEYKKLFRGIKKTKKLKIGFPDNYNLITGNNVEIEGDEYSCEALINYDRPKEEMEMELLEV